MASKIRGKRRIGVASTSDTPHNSNESQSPTGNAEENLVTSLLDKGNGLPFYIKFDTRTTSAFLRASLEIILQRERNYIYQPPPGKVAILMIDDIHLSQEEQVKLLYYLESNIWQTFTKYFSICHHTRYSDR